MEHQDYAKLCYQSAYGPEHMIEDIPAMAEGIAQEWAACAGAECMGEDIGGGLCRLHMGGQIQPDSGRLLAELMARTAAEHKGSRKGLEERLLELGALGIGGMEEWLAGYRQRGCPPVHHSDAFRLAYSPHYRLVKAEYARYFPALAAIGRLAARGGRPALIAIDGRCGSGKSGLAGLIAALFPCNVLHTDDFYLPHESREEGWQRRPGGNMDFPRLRHTLAPLMRGEAAEYRAYNCQTGRLEEPAHMPPRPLTVLEGSYSQHPDIGAEYDLRLFLSCGREELDSRLKAREGDYYPEFQRLWIPMEELYIDTFGIETGSLAIDTSGLF